MPSCIVPDEDQTGEDFVRANIRPLFSADASDRRLFFYLDWFPVEPRQGLPQPRDPPAVPVRRKLCGHVRCEPPVHTNAPIYVDDPQQPYIAKHIFQTQNPPVKLRKITVGDGSLGSQATVEHLPVVSASIQLLHNTDEKPPVKCDRDVPCPYRLRRAGVRVFPRAVRP